MAVFVSKLSKIFPHFSMKYMLKLMDMLHLSTETPTPQNQEESCERKSDSPRREKFFEIFVEHT